MKQLEGEHKWTEDESRLAGLFNMPFLLSCLYCRLFGRRCSSLFPSQDHVHYGECRWIAIWSHCRHCENRQQRSSKRNISSQQSITILLAVMLKPSWDTAPTSEVLKLPRKSFSALIPTLMSAALTILHQGHSSCIHLTLLPQNGGLDHWAEPQIMRL